LEFALYTRPEGDVTILDVSGWITRGETVDAFRSALADLVLTGHTKILVNMRNVEFVDSAGIGVLVAAVTQVTCGPCGATYSNLEQKTCPECGAGMDDGHIDVNSEGGVWIPPWGSLKLLSPNKKIEDLLRLTKLHDAFEIYQEEKKAIQRFQGA